MKPRYTFEEIRLATLGMIRQLPTETPETGLLAGFLPILLEGCEKHYCYDNSHYTAGTTFYRLGVKGVAEKARRNAQSKTGVQRELLEAIATISGTKSKLKKVKASPAKKQVVRRPPVNFSKCGIPLGAELVFTEDPSIIVKVVSERKVEYNGEITSMSAISDSIKGYPTPGPQFFTYNGKKVNDIAARTQWKDYERT